MPKKIFKSCLLLPVILAAFAGAQLSAAETNEESSPSKSYLMAYESMSTADWLLKRGMKEDAAALYAESLKLFQKLAAEYPAWQTNLVAFRINYCHDGFNQALKSDRSEPGSGADGRPASSAASLTQAAIPSRPAESLRPAEPGEKSGGDLANAGKIAQAFKLEQSFDFQGALEFYKAVLAQNNQNSAALGGAGRCFLRLGMVDQARDLLFQWSVIPSPENSINYLLALIFCHDRQFAKAIQLAEILVNDDGSNAPAHVVLGVALAGMGQTDQALSEMQKALALNPRLNEAHYNLARLLLSKEPRNKATAVEYYLNALKFGAAPDPDLAKLLQK